MKRLLIALALAEILTTPVLAAPGDPRLIQGTIEWPVALASEPVMIVRGDDGRVYSVDVSGALRHGNVALRGGGRVALLGLEAAKSHELTALVIGSGDAATLARALSQGLTPVTAPAATAATLPATAATPPVTVATPPVTAPPASATAPSTVAAPVAAVATPAPPAAVTVPATAGTPPAPAATPPATTGTVPPPSANPPVPAGTRVMATPAVASASTERKQWARVDGRVHSVEATTLILRDSNGSLVLVDISNLNPNVTRVLRPGSPVSVYGYPVEQRFEAAGYIELDPAHPEPPRTRWTR